jgi:hypothetical protein
MKTLTGEEAMGISEEAEGIAALVSNPIWQAKVLPKLLDKARLHFGAAIARDKTPQERSEHIEAVHFFREFLPLLDGMLKGRDKKLRQWMEQNAGVL